MEKCDFSYEIVPWFSQEEWLDVYKNIFGNKLEDWKRAYDQISVWRARVTRLPIGVEGTFPLLHAKIAQEEHFLDDAFRRSSLNLGILKFVSCATEGYEYRHLVGHAMHNAASKINLPPYLINIRNDIIHCDYVYGTQTLKSALDNCLQWVKTNYWDVEAENIKENRALEMKQRRERRGSEIENETDEAMQSESPHNLIPFIQDFVKNSLRTVQDKDLAEQQLKEELPKLQILIKDYIYRNADDCITVLVDHLFYHPILRKLKTQQASRCKMQCKCRFNRGVIIMATRVLKYLLNFGLLDLFIRQLIIRGKGYRRLRSGWIHMLANTTLSDADGRCPKHSFIFKQSSLRSAINWKQFLYLLFTLEEIWATELALKISEQNFVGIDANSRGVLKSLVNVYSKGEQPADQSEAEVSKPIKGQKDIKSPKQVKDQTEVCSPEKIDDQTEGRSPKQIKISINEVFDLPTVIQKAKMKLSKQSFEYVNGIYDLVRQSPEKGRDVRKLPLSEMHLGVLPHQDGDPFFYQQLELPAIEPLNKKIRKQIHNGIIA